MARKLFICDKDGWPVETIKGRRIRNFIRLLIHGRKLRRWTPDTQSGASIGCAQEPPKAEEQANE